MGRFKYWTVAFISSLLLAVGFIYAARGLTDIYDKGTNIKTLIADGGLATLVGFIVVILLCELAIAMTLTHKSIEDAKDEKAEILTKINPNMGKGHIFCKIRNDAERVVRHEKVKRRFFISLDDYQEYIDKGGLKNKKLTLWERLYYSRMERKLKKVNFDDFNFAEIVNGISKPEIKKKKRETLSRFRTKKYLSKTFSTIGLGVVFGYYGLKLAENPNWGMVIYLAIQFITFIANGMIQYFFTRSYILTEYRDQIIEDTNF
ncbi:MAG TPA: hypothetical protein PLW60_05820, partial [Bacilli bacterium]|nr:hypothetical protein [Bacilli bacterium]